MALAVSIGWLDTWAYVVQDRRAHRSTMTVKIDVPEVKIIERGKGYYGRPGLKEFGKRIYLSVSVDTRFKRFQRAYRNDRVAFVYDCIPILKETFAPYQEEILADYDAGVKRQAVRSPHSAGKTLLAAIIVHHTLLTTEEDAKVPTLASVWRQLDKYLWPEIHKVAKYLDWEVIGRKPYNRRDELMTLSIRTNGGLSEAFAVASGDATMIEGAHASMLFYIFDESKAIDDDMWDAAEGAFATEDAIAFGGKVSSECYALAISTPGAPRGVFYNIHARKEGYEDWKVKHITLDKAIEARRIGRKWAEQRAKLWGVNSAVYKNRVLGEFATDSSEGVIPLAHIEAAMDRFRVWDEAGRPGEGLGRRELGVDTARMGKDSTVFADRVNDIVEQLHVYSKQRIPVTAGFLKPLAQKSAETKIEMDSGLGAGVYDILDAEQDPYNPSMNLIAVYMGAGTTFMDKTNTFRFNCVRAAAWWNMREMLDPDSGRDIMLVPDDALLGDLAAPKYEIKYWHGYLTIFVEPKDEIRKPARLGRSTDKGDAVVIAFWDGGNSGGGGVVF